VTAIAEIRDRTPDFAEFTLGLAEGKTRGLNPGYDCDTAASAEYKRVARVYDQADPDKSMDQRPLAGSTERTHNGGI
jgi:hypothetical protein